MYGSVREVFIGLLRALPGPSSPAPVRAFRPRVGCRGWPGRQRPPLTALVRGGGDAGRAGSALPPSVPGLLAYLTERWDGNGPLRRAKGEEIPLPMRIVHVATDAAFQRLLGGAEHAARLVRERAGHAFDPAGRGLPRGRAPRRSLRSTSARSAWDEALAWSRARR